MELHFDADICRFAQGYFYNPSYLQVHGVPSCSST